MKQTLYKNLLDEMHDGIYMVDSEKKITYWNRSAERLTGFKEAEVKGTPCKGNILMHCDIQGAVLCNKACPVADTLITGKRFEAEVYLQHKEGHRVPVLMCISPITDSKGKITGAVEIFSDHSWSVAAVKKIEELREISLVDALTDTSNRRFLEMNINNMLAGMRRYNLAFGMLFLDIDHFKNINDTYGHDIGDKVLRMVSKSLGSTLRPLDILGRWGGEEFIALLLNTNKENLLAVANRLRLLVENSALPTDKGTINVTISVGGTIAQADDTIHSLVKRADELMYQSKKNGRNRVSV